MAKHNSLNYSTVISKAISDLKAKKNNRKITFISNLGYERSIFIDDSLPASNAKVKSLTTSIAYNLVLFGGASYIIVKTKSAKFENELCKIIEYYFKTIYSDRLKGNATPFWTVKVTPSQSKKYFLTPRVRLSHLQDVKASNEGLVMGVDVGGSSVKVTIIKNGSIIFEKDGFHHKAKGGGKSFAKSIGEIILKTSKELNIAPQYCTVVMPGMVLNNQPYTFGNLNATWNESDRSEAKNLQRYLEDITDHAFPISIYNDMMGAAAAYQKEIRPTVPTYLLWLGTGVGTTVVQPNQNTMQIYELGMINITSSLPTNLPQTIQNFASGEAIKSANESELQAIGSLLSENILEVYNVTGITSIILGGGIGGSSIGKTLNRYIKDSLQNRYPKVSFVIKNDNKGTTFNSRGAAYIAQQELSAKNSVINQMLIIDKQAKVIATKLSKKTVPEIVIMIPTHRSEPTVIHVVQQITKGLKKYYPDKQAVILVVGEHERATEFRQQVKDIKKIESRNIRIKDVLKDYSCKGKGWSLRLGMQITLGCTIGRRERIFLAIDSDIRNIEPDWIKSFIHPLIHKSAALVFSSYTAREYKEDDRAVKDHFTTPFLSALVNSSISEAEGEYGIRSQEILKRLVNNAKVWSYRYPEFFFIPTAAALKKSMSSVNLPFKEHHWEPHPLGRITEYARTFFDQAIRNTSALVTDIRTGKVFPPNTPASTFVNVDRITCLAESHQYMTSHFNAMLDLMFKADMPSKLIDSLKVFYKHQKKAPSYSARDWAITNFKLLKLYAHESSINRTKILQLLQCLFQIRLADFVKQIRTKTFAESQGLIEEQNQLFIEQAKEYFKEHANE